MPVSQVLPGEGIRGCDGKRAKAWRRLWEAFPCERPDCAAALAAKDAEIARLKTELAREEGMVLHVAEERDKAEAEIARLAGALEDAAEEDERDAWSWARSSDGLVREDTFTEWRAAHPSDIHKTLKRDESEIARLKQGLAAKAVGMRTAEDRGCDIVCEGWRKDKERIQEVEGWHMAEQAAFGEAMDDIAKAAGISIASPNWWDTPRCAQVKKVLDKIGVLRTPKRRAEPEAKPAKEVDG